LVLLDCNLFAGDPRGKFAKVKSDNLMASRKPDSPRVTLRPNPQDMTVMNEQAIMMPFFGIQSSIISSPLIFVSQQAYS
jgi:hypothetical protein